MFENCSSLRYPIKSGILIFVLILTFILIYSVLNSQTSIDKDEISHFSGKYSAYRLNDSTFYNYGEFVITSKKGAKIKAHRLKTINNNTFKTDIVIGVLLPDKLKIVTYKILTDLFEYGSDKTNYLNDSTQVELNGNAYFTTEDLDIEANCILLELR